MLYITVLEISFYVDLMFVRSWGECISFSSAANDHKTANDPSVDGK